MVLVLLGPLPRTRYLWISKESGVWCNSRFGSIFQEDTTGPCQWVSVFSNQADWTMDLHVTRVWSWGTSPHHGEALTCSPQSSSTCEYLLSHKLKKEAKIGIPLNGSGTQQANEWGFLYIDQSEPIYGKKDVKDIPLGTVGEGVAGAPMFGEKGFHLIFTWQKKRLLHYLRKPDAQLNSF